MEHHLRLCPQRQSLEGLKIGEITDLVLPGLTSGPGLGELAEQVGFRFGLQGVGPHLRPQLLQPQQQPAALEAGVTGEQHPPTSPERGIQHHHTFQGAFASAQSSSRCTRSRSVSIGCQKPVW